MSLHSFTRGVREKNERAKSNDARAQAATINPANTLPCSVREGSQPRFLPAAELQRMAPKSTENSTGFKAFPSRTVSPERGPRSAASERASTPKPRP
jgi:hypothetical protein